MYRPLKCEMIEGVLTITVGPEVLAFATKEHPALLDDECNPEFRVINQEEWMKSVGLALSVEDEQGGTPITKMLDDAILYAVEQGYEGIEPVHE